MKKLFLFATIAASGLLVSCSSSDDAVSDALNTAIEDVDANGRPAIHIGIGNIAEMNTRGTGTVGGVTESGHLTGDPDLVANKWAGQHINVFMFTKGALDTDGNIIPERKYETTFNLTNIAAANENPNYLYNNTEMVTPGSAENKIPMMGATAQTESGEAMIEDGTIQYYPLSGNFDFFGYHLDDALDATTADTYDAADKPIKKTDDLWTVPFIIDGTQDLMSTKAALNATQEGIMGANAAANPRYQDYYSAYAARKEVQPILSFNHLLTRFAFFVKAGNKDAAGFTFGKYTAETAATANAGLTGALNSTTALSVDDAAKYNATLNGALPIDATTTYTEAQANTYNSRLTGALAATAGPFYSFTACWTSELANPSWTTTGKVQFIREQAEADGNYTIIQVIQNNLVNHADMDGKYFAVKETATNLANVTNLELYWVTENAGTYNIGSTTQAGTILAGGAISVYNLATVETAAATAAINAYNATLNGHATAGQVCPDATVAKAYNAGLTNSKAADATLSADEAKAYNATLSGAVKEGDDDPNATPVIDDNKAVKVSRVAITSKVKGDMAVAWKGTSGSLTDAQKIVWNTDASNSAVLTLKERPYAKSTTGNDYDNATYADFTDLTTAYGNITDPTSTGADEVTALNNKAVERAKAYITKSTYDLLTDGAGGGKEKYNTFTAQEAMNEKLIALSPTAATWNQTADEANLVPVGEALIVGETPRNDESYVLDLDVTQLLPTNWITGAVEEKTTSQQLLIKKPAAGWQINTSYNIILTVYSLERIEVMTVITPWDEYATPIPVGADD